MKNLAMSLDYVFGVVRPFDLERRLISCHGLREPRLREH
jgi:hypothetical protein